MLPEERQVLLDWITRQYRPLHPLRNAKRSRGVIITEHEPEEPAAAHITTAAIAAWFVDHDGMRPLSVEEAAQCDTDWERDLEQPSETHTIRYSHAYRRARFAERNGTDTVCVTLVWGPRFARGLAVKIKARRFRLFRRGNSALDLAVKVVELNWIS